MPAGIKVIWPNFKRLYAQRAFLQQPQQTKRHRGFAATASCACKNKCVMPCRHYPDPVQGGRGIQVRACSVFRLYASSQPTSHRSCWLSPTGRSSGLASSSPVLPNLAISGLYGVVSITAAGAAGDFHPLPYHKCGKPVGLRYGCTAHP